MTVTELMDATGYAWPDAHLDPAKMAGLSLAASNLLGIENVGGDIDKVTGKRVTFSFFPWRWTRGDGCIIRLVAIVDPTGQYRIETGK